MFELSHGEHADVAPHAQQESQLVEQVAGTIEWSVADSGVRGLDEGEAQVERGRLNAIAEGELVVSREACDAAEEPDVDIVGTLDGGEELVVH